MGGGKQTDGVTEWQDHWGSNIPGVSSTTQPVMVLRDAMPHGDSLSVTTSQVVVKSGTEARFDLPGAGKYVHISVADTGTGIDRTSLERIYNPFYTTKEAPIV